jgi:hypothetical protein
MRHAVVLAMVAALGLGLAGCGADTPESVTEEMIGLMGELNTELGEIKTTDDLKGAKGALDGIGERLTALAKKGNEMGIDDLPKEEAGALKKKYEAEVKKVSIEMGKNLGRIGGLVGTDKDAAKALEGLMTALKDMK